MGNGQKFVYAGIALLAAILLGAVFLSAQAEDEKADAPPQSVNTLKIAVRDEASISTGYAGLVAARRTSALGFERGGLIARVNVDLGDHVRKGDVLAALDTRTVRADIAAARARYQQAKAQSVIAKATQARQQKLVEKGHISRQKLDEINANLLAANAAEAAAKAQVSALVTRLDLSHIVAPYDGMLSERYADEGSIAAPGTPILSLVEDGALEIRIGLPAARAAQLTTGKLYNFSVAGTTFRAPLRGRSGIVDRATQTVSAVFDVPTPLASTLIPGQTARLDLDIPLAQKGFWVPLGALREDRRGLWSILALAPLDGRAGVFTLQPHLVEILYADARRAFVRGPIKDGVDILADGKQGLTAGMHVVPTQRQAHKQP